MNFCEILENEKSEWKMCFQSISIYPNKNFASRIPSRSDKLINERQMLLIERLGYIHEFM